MALGKQVQPNLDVRFAKHLLVRSSDVIDAGDSTVSSDGGWKTNAAGFHFNQNYGFGQINADQFTQTANEFQAVTPLSTQTTGTVTVNKSIPDNNKNGIVSEFSLSGALPLEEIKIHLNITHTYVGDLEAYLTSPSGTVSRLMLSSASGADNLDWDFVSNAFWGENPQGTWNLMVRDVALNDTGTWNSFSATANKGTLTSGTLSSISIDDVTQAEGNTGNAIFNFTVSLTPASSGTVTVNYATANGTATAGSDYQSANGTLTFSPGQTTKMVTVNVIGDTTVEPNETFFVNLSGASGAAVISRAQGVGTITNDDQSTQPDFVVTGVTLNPASPCRGRTFKATVTVRNQGGVSASAGYLKVWANQPSVQSCTASANTLSWIGTLAAGASKSITVYLPGQSEGTKTLRAFVDGSCRTAESDETNNQFPLDYNIVALCPPK
jgi:subtilisin-like proprotein convertase family protein